MFVCEMHACLCSHPDSDENDTINLSLCLSYTEMCSTCSVKYLPTPPGIEYNYTDTRCDHAVAGCPHFSSGNHRPHNYWHASVEMSQTQ